MSRSTLRPKTVRPLAVALGLGMGLAVLAPSPFVPEAAAQFSFGGSRLGSGQDRPARTPGGMSGGSPWTRPPIRIAPIPLPIGPRFDEPVYDEERGAAGPAPSPDRGRRGGALAPPAASAAKTGEAGPARGEARAPGSQTCPHNPP